MEVVLVVFTTITATDLIRISTLTSYGILVGIWVHNALTLNFVAKYGEEFLSIVVDKVL